MASLPQIDTQAGVNRLDQYQREQHLHRVLPIKTPSLLQIDPNIFVIIH